MIDKPNTSSSTSESELSELSSILWDLDLEACKKSTLFNSFPTDKLYKQIGPRSGPEVIKKIMLNSTEHDIYTANKC